MVFFILSIYQKENEALSETHFKWSEEEILAINTYLLYLCQAKEKRVSCIKGPIKNSRCCGMSREYYVLDLQNYLNNTITCQKTLVTFRVF